MRMRLHTRGWQPGGEEIYRAVTLWPRFAYKQFIQHLTNFHSVIAF